MRSSVSSEQTLADTLLFSLGKEVGIESLAVRLDAVVSNMPIYVFNRESEEYRRRIHPRTDSLRTDWGETQHAPIERDVAGIDFDERIGASEFEAGADVAYVRQECEHDHRKASFINGQACYLVWAASRCSQMIDLVREGLVGRQPYRRIRLHRERAYGVIASRRNQYDSVRMLGIGRTLIATRGVHPMKQHIGRIAVPVGIGESDAELFLLDLDIHDPWHGRLIEREG
jgi:hypothetical protein